MIRTRLLLIICALIGCLVPRLDAAPNFERTVILISIDGLASYYFDDPRADIPTLRRLAAEGARAQRMECSFPTVTWPNHTTLVTGVNPGRHGVIGNNYYDRNEQKKVPFIPDPLFDKAEIVRVPTVYDVAHEAGLETAGICWPATRNASSLDWTVPDVFDQQIFEGASTPALLAEFRRQQIPYWKQMEWCKAGNAGKPQRDWMYTRMTTHVIGAHRPNLILLHLVTVDALEHATGRQSPEAYWAVNDSDQRVRQIVEAVESAGLRDRTTFVIASDHGFVNYTRQIQPNVLLRQMGLLETAGPQVRSARAFCLSQGGGAFVYILDDTHRDAIRQDLQTRLATLEGVDAVVGPGEFAKWGHRLPSENPQEPDLMLSAAEGYSFSETAAGDLTVSPGGPQRGSHGARPSHPNMYGTCIFSGAGIRPGVEVKQVRNLDVAPTMAALLGLRMENVDGRVIKNFLK